jgi:twinkle protein
METFSDFDIEIPAGARGQVRVLCPRCSAERRKSREKCLSVDVSKGVWFCHHCGYAGGLGSEKPFSSERISKTVTIPKYTAKTDLPGNVIQYFQNRGISERVLKAEKVGYGSSWKDKNGIQFPYFKGGIAVNVKHRSHEKEFRQEKNAEKCLYRFDQITNCKGDPLIIAEGEIDCLSFLEAGFEMVTSIPDGAPNEGSKNYTTKFDFLKSAEAIFENHKKIILAMDNDANGKTAERELARRIGLERCYRIQYPQGCKDANDVLVKYGTEAVKQIISAAKAYPIAGIFTAADLRDEVIARYHHGAGRGLSTGLATLDPFYTVKPGELTVVTGIPGSGKSEFVDALAVRMAGLHDWKFAFFSPENLPVSRHISKLIEKINGKPFAQNGFDERRMTIEEVDQCIDIMNDYLFFIYPEDEILSVDTVLEKARITIFRYGVHGIVIDPWNELEHFHGNLTEAQYLSRELTKIRRFARVNQVHIWVVAHPRNLVKDLNGDYRPPTMYEIAGGAHWRNKADNGLCIHRPDYSVDETEVYIQKIRFKEVGKIGHISLIYARDSGEYIEKSPIQ